MDTILGVEGSVTSTNLVLVDPGAFETTICVSFGKKWSVLVELVSILSFLDFVVGFVVTVPIVVDLSMADVEEFAVAFCVITFSAFDSVGETIVEESSVRIVAVVVLVEIVVLAMVDWTELDFILSADVGKDLWLEIETLGVVGRVTLPVLVVENCVSFLIPLVD